VEQKEGQLLSKLTVQSCGMTSGQTHQVSADSPVPKLLIAELQEPGSLIYPGGWCRILLTKQLQRQ